MAIPVVYKSSVDEAALFHAVEAVVSLSLVVGFTYMLNRVFLTKADDLMSLVPFLIMLIGDILVLALRWKESVNSFVLVFVSISTLMFIIGRLLIHYRA